MKKTSILLLGAVALLSSCGMIASSTSSDDGQKFQDGIYSNTPSFRSKTEKAASKSAADALVSRTKESPIYLFGDRKDTIMIPENMSARIQFDQKVGGTTVTIGENPYDWRWDLENRYGYYYGPYSLGASWYWRHYSPFYNPYWCSWTYSPWRYHGYYDPWYYGGFYDPWYHYHHHVGWYDPHYHGPSHIGGGIHKKDRYYGLRAGTERNAIAGGSSDRSTIRTSGGTIRGGMSIGNTTSRASSSVRRSGGTVSRPASVTRQSSSSNVSASRSSTMTRSSSSSTYRRPASSSTSTKSQGSSEYSGYSRSSSYGSSSYDRNSSSSYSRSSSSGYSRGGSSSSSYSRGSSGGSSYSRGSSGSYRR